VLTGGGARLAGINELARDALEMPVRVASPEGIGGLMDQLSGPAFSVALGLLLWGAHHPASDLGGFGTTTGESGVGRAVGWLRSLFPG